MTDEEKKAIAIFKSYINAIETFGTIDYKCINNLYEPAITLLNLITKLQKENKNSISKDIIRNKINERQFELQQEYKDFKDDIKLNTLQELYYYKSKE